MKKVVNVEISNRNFIMDEDAYERLKAYLDAFHEKTNMGCQTKEVMEELEMRIAEIFAESLKGKEGIVNIMLVNNVIAQLGMPDGSDETVGNNAGFSTSSENTTRKKLYRDADNGTLGGVCSGLGFYFEVDTAIFRVLFVVGVIFGLLSFWIYVILWICLPKAQTLVQKCEMRGWAATAENMRKLSSIRK